MQAEAQQLKYVLSDMGIASMAAEAVGRHDVVLMIASGVYDTGLDGSFKPDAYLTQQLQR